MQQRTSNPLTSAQQRAVDARGNVLVMAGAGTGKTHTLVQRCLDLVDTERASLDEILVVTFTEAAATEMRLRLRAALERKSADAADAHFAEQLALFDAAHIGTLHSFCLKLVREHFHELGLDPQFTVLDQGQGRLLAHETLEEQFNAHYEGDDAFSLAVQELIKLYGNGRDETVRGLVLKLHHYVQTRADGERWLTGQVEQFSGGRPAQWHEWMTDAIPAWCKEWTPVLERLRGGNKKAGECLEILQKFKSTELVQKILAIDWPHGTKKFQEPIKEFLDDARFLQSLLPAKGKDPLAEDWNWVRGHMQTLLLLAREFAGQFSERKRSEGGLDFHDLEQFALRLLWADDDAPSEIARRWREKLRFVFVDEYQDINAAQDKIVQALSREAGAANRFLVGDVKQSIYRFRLADPAIFRRYASAWHDKAIPLAENFRGHASLLEFTNSLFERLMLPDVGGIQYDDDARLKAGRPPVDGAAPAPRAELLLRIKSNGREPADADNDGLADLEESEKEARMLALRLRRLHDSGARIHDGDRLRPVEWRDMAILLRAPSGKAEIYAKQFERAGVPLTVERGGFYDSSEIADLFSLLELLDNPLQDVPLIAVLRSPLVGLSLDELAGVRLAGKDQFWFALNQAHRPDAAGPAAEKIGRFLERFARWRKLAKQGSLSRTLEQVLDETYYADWLKAQPRGAQRSGNVERFVHLTERFDQFQRQGLFRFLKFVEAQREVEAEPEVAPSAEENAVRLMSIHQSKGLEFPVVAVGDLGKDFNLQDLRGEIILDETFGLCPRVKPPQAGRRYPSLPHWLAQKNQRRELAGEELRLLYVAITRARDMLVLSGSLSQKKWETVWAGPGAIASRDIVSAKSYADWLGLWFAQNANGSAAASGELPHVRWRLVDDAELALEQAGEAASRTTTDGAVLDDQTIAGLKQRLGWRYGFEAATARAAKSSVTVLRREANEELVSEEAELVFGVQGKRLARTSLRKNASAVAKAIADRSARQALAPPRLNAADTGLAHHKFLQHFRLEAAGTLKALQAEAKRLVEEKYLSEGECAVLELKNILAFWESGIGKQIGSKPGTVRRELPFTVRFGPDELDAMLGTDSSAGLADEFVVVQGVADLVVLLPAEIWLVDFKTDDVGAKDLPPKIAMYVPQLKLYARALEKIYDRPVTRRWLHFLSAQRTEEV